MFAAMTNSPTTEMWRPNEIIITILSMFDKMTFDRIAGAMF